MPRWANAGLYNPGATSLGIENLLITTNALAAHDVDAGWTLALQRISEMVDASSGFAMLAGRTEDHADPLGGWRPQRMMWFKRSAESQAIGRDWITTNTAGLDDPVTQAFCARAGTHRAMRGVDITPPEVWETSPAKKLLDQLGLRDRLIAAHTLSDDVEVYLGLDRASAQPEFTDEDIAVALRAITGLGRMCRWLALSFGLLPQMKLLTTREREVLRHLLTGAPEKQFAASLGLTPAYTHQVVVRVYRKLDVSSRAELMSLWLAAYAP